jgi:hypothetical protein
MCSTRDLFRRTELKKCGRDINCPLDCGSKVKNYIIPQSKQKRAALWWIFSSNNSAPAKMQTVIRISSRLDSFLHEAAQNFEVF